MQPAPAKQLQPLLRGLKITGEAHPAQNTGAHNHKKHQAWRTRPLPTETWTCCSLLAMTGTDGQLPLQPRVDTQQCYSHIQVRLSQSRPPMRSSTRASCQHQQCARASRCTHAWHGKKKQKAAWPAVCTAHRSAHSMLTMHAPTPPVCAKDNTRSNRPGTATATQHRNKTTRKEGQLARNPCFSQPSSFAPNKHSSAHACCWLEPTAQTRPTNTAGARMHQTATHVTFSPKPLRRPMHHSKLCVQTCTTMREPPPCTAGAVGQHVPSCPLQPAAHMHTQLLIVVCQLPGADAPVGLVNLLLQRLVLLQKTL